MTNNVLALLLLMLLLLLYYHYYTRFADFLKPDGMKSMAEGWPFRWDMGPGGIIRPALAKYPAM